MFEESAAQPALYSRHSASWMKLFKAPRSRLLQMPTNCFTVQSHKKPASKPKRSKKYGPYDYVQPEKNTTTCINSPVVSHPEETLFKVAHEWAQSIAKPVTRTRYMGMIKEYLKPWFPEMPINQLSPRMIREQFFNMRVDGRGNSYLFNAYSALSMIINYAIGLRIMRKSPLANIAKPVHKPDVPVPFKSAEITRLLKAVKDKPDGYTIIWLLMLTCGLRSGEARQLEWSDVDLEAGVITIRSQIAKTDASRRTIPLSTSCKQWFAEHKDHPQTGVIGRNRNNAAVSYNTLLYAWKRLIKRAGVDYKRMHVCRHSCGSYLASKGVPMRSIQALLGHETAAMSAYYSQQTVEQLTKVFTKISM